MLKNNIRNFSLVSLLVFLSGCSSKPIYTAFVEFGTSITNLIGTPSVVVGLMFVALLIGTFAMFKGLLRFSFAKTMGTGTFGPKEINVIALMLAVIGSTGIFFIFRSKPEIMISYFGGFAGLFLVIFLIIFMMGTMINFANSFKDDDGALGKGPAWIFIFVLGVILSSYLLLGYLGQILKSLGCNLSNVDKITCASADSSFNLFLKFYVLIFDILAFLLPFAIIVGIWWFMNKKKEGSEKAEAKKASSPSIKEDEKENKEKADEVKKLMKGFSDSLKSARDAAKDKEKALVDLQKVLRGR